MVSWMLWSCRRRHGKWRPGMSRHRHCRHGVVTASQKTGKKGGRPRMMGKHIIYRIYSILKNIFGWLPKNKRLGLTGSWCLISELVTWKIEAWQRLNSIFQLFSEKSTSTSPYLVSGWTSINPNRVSEFQTNPCISGNVKFIFLNGGFFDDGMGVDRQENGGWDRWVWVNTYRYIFSGMNIHLPAILGFTRYQGFDPSPDEHRPSI